MYINYSTRHYFRQNETIKSFDESIYTQKISIIKEEVNQSNILKKIVEFNNKNTPKSMKNNNKKGDTFESGYPLYKG